VVSTLLSTFLGFKKKITKKPPLKIDNNPIYFNFKIGTKKCLIKSYLRIKIGTKNHDKRYELQIVTFFNEKIVTQSNISKLIYKK
jgi:hypothetical protein